MVAIIIKRNIKQTTVDILFSYIQIIFKGTILMSEMVKLFIECYVLLIEKFGRRINLFIYLNPKPLL